MALHDDRIAHKADEQRWELLTNSGPELVQICCAAAF
jgi:hypothetical protein